MTIDPNIRDQAYQFFIEEASELLDIIETGLLNLRPEVTVPKVHEIMRAAHSIKGGAASVDLDTIKTIAHRLEDAFKALYSDAVISMRSWKLCCCAPTIAYVIPCSRKSTRAPLMKNKP